MKKLILTLFVFVSVLQLKAQVGFNYSQYDIGFSGAINGTMTDFTKSRSKYAGALNFTYNFSPYLNYVIEVQAGTFAGDSLTFVPYTSFQNKYTSLAFKGQVQLGEIMDYSGSSFKNAFKNLYLSTGVGVLYSQATIASFGTVTELSKASNIFIPVKIGYEFKAFNDYNEPWLKVDLGYQYNYVFTDTLDGLASGKSRDMFSQFVIGFKFALGGTTSYRKQIDY